jgi:hypothetical protein
MRSREILLLRFLIRPSNLILIAINMVPVIGVIAWQWDAFVLLILYWLETAIIAFWTVARIATTPGDELGDLQLDERTTSPIGLAMLFALLSAVFMGVHFLFLWALFSGEWPGRIHGIADFARRVIIETGIWMPLLVLFVGRGIIVLLDLAKRRLLPKLDPDRWPSADRDGRAASEGSTAVFALFLRIFIMQVAIIIGAWFAMLLGSIAPFLLLIAIKTAADVGLHLLIDMVGSAWMRAKALQPGGRNT